MREPEETGGAALAGGEEDGAHLSTCQRGLRLVGRGEDDRDAGTRGDPGGIDLGDHAAGADARGAGCADRDGGQVVRRAHHRHELRTRAARGSVVEAVDVGEQDQQVGVHEVRDQRGQPVVVTEADLGGGDRVVLVDDRQDAELEQLGERLVGVAVVGAPDDVVHREEHLPGDEVVAGELLLVAVREESLPDRGRRLLGGERARALRQAQRGQPGGDRPGRDQHDLGSAGTHRGEHVDEPAHARRVDPAGRRGQRRRADLDDDTACLTDEGAAVQRRALGHPIGHSSPSQSGSSFEPIS
ncbi:phosphoglucomutase/phosphomannomutase [Nocardioides sp. CF8]|nr:phosphoglucomutase/phosphomannomutase [Nocardioides sp. CF8]